MSGFPSRRINTKGPDPSPRVRADSRISRARPHSGTQSWIQRLVIRGRKRELGLGSVALVSLAEARDQAVANRKLALSGGDPLAEKRRAEGIPTFAEDARRVVERKQAGWRNPKSATNWLQSLDAYVFPRIGKIAVSEVTSTDMLEVLTPIWHLKAETARAVRHRMRAVLEWSIVMGWRKDNPCDRLLPVLGPQHDVVQHRRALLHGEVATALARVWASEPATADTLALEFLVLTAARGGEVRGALWTEIDQEAGVWTIPASRMKANRPRRVPLCGRALEKYRIAAVPHGFRSSFRDWAAEETNHPREVIEAALAHVVRNPVEAAYARSDLFERRRRLMDDWAGYLAGPS